MLLVYDKNIGFGQTLLSAQQSHHCISVLRMGKGDELLVGDGVGTIYKARIVDTAGKLCVVDSVDTEVGFGSGRYGIDLAIAPTKNFERFEWAVEKAVEIGVDSITPLLSSRCERKVVKGERLAKIVNSAASQSLKSFLPQLNELTVFEDFVKSHRGGLIAHCNDGLERHLMPVGCERYTILIGPEGDFSPLEVELAILNGYTGITLGDERLRTETAAIYAVIRASIMKGL